jgi:rubredoxin
LRQIEVKARIAHHRSSIGATILPMPANPIDDWQRLTVHYRELGDDELRELAADFNDLTETAQQALRSEMQSRGLGDPLGASNSPRAVNGPLAAPATHQASAPIHERTDSALGFFNRRPELVPDSPGTSAEVDGPVEYTWKTLLCECDTSLQARELSEALQQAGIESWIEAPGTGSRYASFGLASPRVLVAADQLDQARAIAAQPIPLQIVDDAQTEIPDYQPPTCPECGASGPALMGVDPANSWKCEQCGHEWTDSAPSEAPKAG